MDSVVAMTEPLVVALDTYDVMATSLEEWIICLLDIIKTFALLLSMSANF